MKRWFKHVEEAVDYLMSLSDSDVSDISDKNLEICQFPLDKSEHILEKEDTDDNILRPVIQADVCAFFQRDYPLLKSIKSLFTEFTSSNIISVDKIAFKIKVKIKK